MLRGVKELLNAMNKLEWSSIQRLMFAYNANSEENESFYLEDQKVFPVSSMRTDVRTHHKERLPFEDWVELSQ